MRKREMKMGENKTKEAKRKGESRREEGGAKKKRCSGLNKNAPISYYV